MNTDLRNLKNLRGHLEGPHGWASQPYLKYEKAQAQHALEHSAAPGGIGGVGSFNVHTHDADGQAVPEGHGAAWSIHGLGDGSTPGWDGYTGSAGDRRK